MADPDNRYALQTRQAPSWRGLLALALGRGWFIAAIQLLTDHGAWRERIRSCAMPTISMFYGIVVSVFYADDERHHLPHIYFATKA